MANTRIHGKNAVLYLGAAGGNAILISELADWSIDADTAMVDASVLNLTWKTHVKGMLGYSGAFSGNFNRAQQQVWTAHNSDVPEKFYLYPTSADQTQYYYGTAWVQLNKIAAGSTTSKASSGFKITGDGALLVNAAAARLGVPAGQGIAKS